MEDLMQKPWFEKHRPRNIDEVVFESAEDERKIKSFIEQGYIQGNIISYGPGGVGKTTINKILLHSIVKSKDDYFVLKKSVASIEELKSWLINSSIASKQRIVICEEFDQLSPQAQTALKDGLMEKYMPKVAFIVTTNNIHSLDPALLQRFNEKLNFTTFNVDGCYFRMKHILELENIKHNDDELYQVVDSFKNKGIRELINNLQSASVNGEFSLANLNANIVSTSGIEDIILSYIKYYFQVILAESDMEKVFTVCNTPTQSIVNDYYSPMLKFMETDPSINYDYIYRTLLNDHDVTLPLKNVITKYYQQAKLVPLNNIHLQSCLFECFVSLYTLKGGEKKLIH